MRILQILVLMFLVNSFVNAQKAILSGYVTDSAGASIQNTKVILTDEKMKTISVLTNEDGFYSFHTLKGKYTLEFYPMNGFEITKILNFEISKKATKFDIALGIDLTNVVVSELVCKPKSENSNDLECEYVCSQKNGERKTKIIEYKNSAKNKTQK
jgi:hypothetical protein